MKKYIIEAIFVAIALTAGLRLGSGDGFIYAFWAILGYFFVSRRFPTFPVLISFFATNWILKEEIDKAVPKDSFTADVFSLVYVGYMYFFGFAIAVGVGVVVLMTLHSMYQAYAAKKRKKAMAHLMVAKASSYEEVLSVESKKIYSEEPIDNKQYITTQNPKDT